jgi:hypothetical protein
MISAGVINSPLAKNGTLVGNGTVISDLYFFGQSPPVYPSPLGNGTGDWAESYVSAAALVAQLTMDEKVSLPTVSYVYHVESDLHRSVLQAALGRVMVVMETSLQYLV